MFTVQPDIAATRRHWDEQAATYDAAKRRNDAYYSTLKRCFSVAVPGESRGRVLDVGCGTGQILASLNPQQGVGIDLSERMIAAARVAYAGRPELRFDICPAADVRSRGHDTLDAVISADMLEHADEWRAAVTAMVEVCRPGGVIALSTPNPTWALPLWVLEKARLKMPEGPHRFVRARHVSAHLRNLGCVQASCRTHLLLPMHLRGAGPALNRIAARVPMLDRLGVIQIITARRPPA
jgi:2-polyprenyl-3-methyl-5-hydroxy-6-metoxy-1,4-benzoquinol methylase